ncbi:MAG: TonB family protein [Verrucomicrobia bacterium]|nr:TonB family protein [Verrucomicrobiota bacterium]MCF7708980.1 TonB family protein [Verrucomicrobiota bacterium]
MNRIQKKCLIFSAFAHAGLIGALVFTPAFSGEPEPPKNMPILDIIPSKVIDEMFYKAPSRPTPQPAQQSMRTQQPPPEPVRDVQKEPSQPKPDNPKIKVNLNPIVRSSNNNSTPKEKEKENSTQTQYNSAIEKIRSQLSPGITIETTGAGGEAYANYAQVVKSVYNRAWQAPAKASGNSISVLISTTIARNGSVASSQILRSSGNSELDKSVQRTLDRVTYVAPFPEGAKEMQRTFKIEFILEKN